MRGPPLSVCSSHSSGSTSSSCASWPSAVAADGSEGVSDLEPESELDESEGVSDLSELRETETPGEPLGAARAFAGVVVALAAMIFGQIPLAIIVKSFPDLFVQVVPVCLLYTSPSPRD